MSIPLPRRVWLEVSPTALARNFMNICGAVSPCAVMPVLKANAYGLGMLPIAEILAAAGAARFGVAEPHEAFALLPLGKPVQILSTVLPEEIPALVSAGVVLPVTDSATAQLISAAGPARVHIKIDTGMGRAGIPLPEALETVTAIRAACPNLVFEGLFTHFPQAYLNDAFTQNQIVQLLHLRAALAERGITFELFHCANSDAVNNVPEALRVPFNLVRTGLNLYGVFDEGGRANLNLAAVLRLKTRLAAVRTLPAGMSIGYGQTYQLPRTMRVGTISAGYADGLPLALSNHGQVDIRGMACPIIGRVSMDYTTVSLEGAPEAQVGDEVTCLGGSSGVQDWAALKQTHPYDIVCSFGNRVERRYVDSSPPPGAP